MSALGDVYLTINDGQGGTVQVAASTVQAIMGCCTSGTNYQILATNNPTSVASTFGAGPLVEAGALTCTQGGTVLCVKVPLTTRGVASAVTATAGNTSTSTVTVTVDGTSGAFDDNLVKVLVVVGGTRGTQDGKQLQVSLDAGRTYGPPIMLGAALTYVIAASGLTVNFGAGSLVAGDSFTFSTTGPVWADADMNTALQTLANSSYGATGWGAGTWMVGNGGAGVAPTGGVTGADVSTIETYLDTMATDYDYTRAFVSARDASPPAAYGGTGESESAWITSLQNDQSNVSAKRVSHCAGNWNVPAAIANASAGTPLRRRNFAWAVAPKQVTIPPQRHAGRVSDGPLPLIVINPTTDSSDGFVYHDEFQNPGLDYKTSGFGARYQTSRRRKGQPGVFVSQPLTVAPLGSDFWMLPLGFVMDVACAIVHQVGEQFINDDVRLTNGGTLYATDALTIGAAFQGAIAQYMLAAKMISPGTTVVVSTTQNVRTTGIVPVTVTINARGYILAETINIGYGNQAAA